MVWFEMRVAQHIALKRMVTGLQNGVVGSFDMFEVRRSTRKIII